MASNMIDPRLSSAASFVRAGAVFADIGTDHGYLPIFLLGEGRISRAVLADINEGPLSKAKENASRHGLSHLCEFVLTDGAAALSDKGITDYAICGMGGELIAEIIARAPHLADGSVRLILQPMSRQEHLRRELYRMGFSIVAERYSVAEGKRYVSICAEYTATPCEISDEIAYLGLGPTDETDIPAYLAYLTAKRDSIAKAAEAREKAGIADNYKDIVTLLDGRIEKYSKM